MSQDEPTTCGEDPELPMVAVTFLTYNLCFGFTLLDRFMIYRERQSNHTV